MRALCRQCSWLVVVIGWFGGAKVLFLSQRDTSGLATHNNELKFRLQAMEQQAQLRDGE